MSENFNSTTTREVAKQKGYRVISTTSEMNNYPRDLKHVIVAQNIDNILSIKSELEGEGFEVEEWFLTKNEDNRLWTRRENTSINKGYFLNKEIDKDVSIVIDNDTDDVESKVVDLFYESSSKFQELVNGKVGEFTEDIEDNEDNTDIQEEAEILAEAILLRPVNDFINKLPKTGKIRVQYDNSLKSKDITRIITDNCSRYKVRDNDYIIGLSIKEI